MDKRGNAVIISLVIAAVIIILLLVCSHQKNQLNKCRTDLEGCINESIQDKERINQLQNENKELTDKLSYYKFFNYQLPIVIVNISALGLAFLLGLGLSFSIFKIDFNIEIRSKKMTWLKIIFGIIGFSILIADVVYYWNRIAAMPPEIGIPAFWILGFVGAVILFIGASLPKE